VYLIQLKIKEKNIRDFHVIRKNETNKIIPIEHVLHFEVLANSTLGFRWKNTLASLDSSQLADFIFICIAVRLSEIAN